MPLNTEKLATAVQAFYVIETMKKIYLITVSLLFILLSPPDAYAQEQEDFGLWLQNMKLEAIKAGVSDDMVNLVLSDIKPIPRVIELDRKQPEGKWSFAQYREKIVHPFRIKRGREMMQKHRDLLASVESRYGVPPQYIVALWGIETNYGTNTGGFEVIPALATLAWEGRRAAFFKKELIHALKILDQGHIAPPDMTGSWAGAMGQNQFMPSSFHAFATDGNNDGHKNIWGDIEDVFASSSNYLARSGWKSDERWGREVSLPRGFPAPAIGLETQKTLQNWSDMGVRLKNGGPIPVVAGMKASVVAPDGVGGDAFLVYDNYRTIMKWNKSTYFASSVGLLADAIASAP